MKRKIPIIVIISILLLSTGSISTMAYLPKVELPPTTIYVTMCATRGVISTFDMKISDVPPGYDIVDGTYLGWCAQKNIQISEGVNHTVRLYSSYDPNMPGYNGNVTWSKINYILNHKQGNRDSIQEAIWYYMNLNIYPSDPYSQAMINDAEQNGSGFIPTTGEILAIIVDGIKTIQRTFFEYMISYPSSNEPNNPPVGIIAQNHAPTADASIGEPYTGFARGEITFDGSNSYDRDGIIISWKWDFGDETTGSGEIVKHSYANPGTYNVTLTVKDEKGATDSYMTTATIIKGNNPPNTPTISGPISGHKNTLYEFNVVSTDPDGDSLQYIFNWGDGKIITTFYYPSETPITQTHVWNASGHYTITVKAYDNNTESGIATINILIDILYVEDLGYLIKEDNDGIYDSFYNNATGMQTKVEKLSNGNYLIDVDGDGIRDYEYNPVSNELSIYQEQPIFEYILVAIILILCFILFFVLEQIRKGLKLKKKQ